MIDAIAREGHFVDHIAPVWLALPPEQRGTFYVRSNIRGRDVPGIVRGDPPKSDRPTLTASATDLWRSRKAGRPTAIMEHGCGQSFGGDPKHGDHSSYAGGKNRDAQLFLHPGPHPAGRDRAVHPEARIEIVGCPKLDTLPHKERGREPVIAVAFHWQCRICPETRSAVGDFRNEIIALARRFRVIGHGHPRIIDQIAPWYLRHGIEVVRSFEEVCRRADVYLNDASSTLFEFASTGRPVVVLNSPFYRRKVCHGLRFWEAATVGVQVIPGQDLAEAVERALEDAPPQQAARERALSLVYAYRSGAAERAAAALVDWAGHP